MIFSCQYLQFWITTDGNSNSIKEAQAYNSIRVNCINKQIIHKINVNLKFDCINLFNISRLPYYCTNQDHEKQHFLVVRVSTTSCLADRFSGREAIVSLFLDFVKFLYYA